MFKVHNICSDYIAEVIIYYFKFLLSLVVSLHPFNKLLKGPWVFLLDLYVHVHHVGANKCKLKFFKAERTVLKRNEISAMLKPKRTTT